MVEKQCGEKSECACVCASVLGGGARESCGGGGGWCGCFLALQQSLRRVTVSLFRSDSDARQIGSNARGKIN